MRWGTLERPAPSARLVGLLALAVLVAGAGPWLDRRSRTLSVAGVALALLGMLALAGIPVTWLTHARIAVITRGVGLGLSQLSGLLVPYLGVDAWVKLVIALGAGVLLLDAAVMIAFAPQSVGDVRRAAAALPLIALVVVPSTLAAPRLAYVQGFVLFALVAAFMWGERVARARAGGAVLAATIAGVAGALIAPRIDQHHPWIDYQRLAGSLAPAHVDTFNWAQTYGAFSWPREARTVLEVGATQPDYWKAENLDLFNGVGWAAGANVISARVPGPIETELRRFSQTIQITVRAMDTAEVIGAGFSAHPDHLSQEAVPGTSSGTWITGSPLGPGDSYTVKTYSPTPSASELTSDRGTYPLAALADELTIELPAQTRPGLAVRLPVFHSRTTPRTVVGPSGVSGAALIAGSPYANAYALARSLSRRAATPYAFVLAVERQLSTANGFTYDENPPLSNYPLETFLFSSHRGYCQQFAGAMALLLRMGGVPARVSTGFATGHYDAGLRWYVVSDVDAHAWVEAWFPAYGWVRFDPTPASAPARAGGGVQTALGLGLTGGNGQPSGADVPRASSAPGAHSVHRHGSGHGLPVAPLAIAFAALVALAVLIARRLTAAPLNAQQLVTELERALVRSRRPPARGVTLQAIERSFNGAPGAQRYVRALRLARFAGAGELPDLRQRRALRAALRAGLGARGRLRAWWALPPRVLH